jgi:hypothetical protein
MENKKYSKPEGFCGRGKGNKNYKKNKWSVIVFDKETNTFKEGRYPTIEKVNEDLDLKLTGDIVWRLVTGNKVDTKQRNGKNSFLNRYGHIKILKIDEKISV